MMLTGRAITSAQIPFNKTWCHERPQEKKWIKNGSQVARSRSTHWQSQNKTDHQTKVRTLVGRDWPPISEENCQTDFKLAVEQTLDMYYGLVISIQRKEAQIYAPFLEKKDP